MKQIFPERWENDPLNAALGATPPEFLYHYTSSAGLMGMLSSSTVWASNARWLNDSRELELAIDRYQQAAKNLIQQEKGAIAQEILEVINHGIDERWFYENRSIYVVSFSEEGDLLSQWRGYCPAGAGYALGFDTTLLRKLKNEQELVLGRCIYSREQQHLIAEQIISENLRNIEKWITEGGDLDRDALNEAAAMILADLLFLAPLIKDPAFAEEREWRMMKFVFAEEGESTEVMYRPGKSMLVPYISLRLRAEDSPMPVERVIVGPTPHPELARQSMAGYLRSLNMPAQVVNSDAPYRDW